MQPLDYGVFRPKRSSPSLIAVGVIAATAFAAASFTPKLLKAWRAADAETAAWTFSGPPCPEVSESAFRAAPYQDRKKFEYVGVVFGRAIGHASCTKLRRGDWRMLFDGYPVCHFTSPAVLSVETPRARTYYLTGVGQRATVTVAGERPSCVLAGRFL